MTTPRRTGTTDSATRSRMLAVAERLMVEEGHAAVTSRRIAQEAEVTSPLVHYYFRSMDDLFVELLEKIAAENLDRQEQALASPRPLHALWKLTSHPAGAAATAEFAALAVHRKTIRAEIARHAVRFREQQVDILRTLAARGDLAGTPDDIAGVVFVLTGIGRILGQEQQLGISLDHDHARAFMARLIDDIEGADA
jgi:AcrR family transcriptional regulator